MNHYLRLVANPMHPRFQFRKNLPQTSPVTGIIYVVLCFPTYNPKTEKKKNVESVPYSTGIRASLDTWTTRRSPRQTPERLELNRQLSAYQAALEAAHAHLEQQNKEAQRPRIIDGKLVMKTMHKLSLGQSTYITLPEVYNQFYAYRETMVETDMKKRGAEQISQGTLITYPKRWVLIQQFLHAQKTPRLPIQSVTRAFATDLKEWMFRQKQSRRSDKEKYSPAYVKKIIELLKMLTAYAETKEYIQEDPLLKFVVKGSTSQADPKPLTEKQLQHLETVELPPVLRYQCDSWLVFGELCMHYEEAKQLQSMQIIQGEEGVMLVEIDRNKTGVRQTINVTPRASRLLEKYGGPKGLYYTSSSYWSKILKKVARLAELKDAEGVIIPLQFGQGRDSGLTSRAIQGASSIQLSRIAGWKKPSEADRYIGLSREIVSEFARKLPEQEVKVDAEK